MSLKRGGYHTDSLCVEEVRRVSMKKPAQHLVDRGASSPLDKNDKLVKDQNGDRREGIAR